MLRIEVKGVGEVTKLMEVEEVVYFVDVGGDDRCRELALLALSFVDLYFFIPHSSKCIRYARTLSHLLIAVDDM
jgi:hypothetical protein